MTPFKEDFPGGIKETEDTEMHGLKDAVEIAGEGMWQFAIAWWFFQRWLLDVDIHGRMDCFIPYKRCGRCLQCAHNDLDLRRDQFHAQILQSRRIDWVQEVVELMAPQER